MNRKDPHDDARFWMIVSAGALLGLWYLIEVFSLVHPW